MTRRGLSLAENHHPWWNWASRSLPPAPARDFLPAL